MRRIDDRTALALFQWASFISVLGSRSQGFGSSMELTENVSHVPVPVALAAAFAFNQWPYIVFPLLGGRLGDRFSRRSVVLGAQVLLMMQSLLLFWVYKSVVALYVLSMTASVTVALSNPALGALIQDLAPSGKLHTALATNTAFRHSAWIIGTLVSSLVVFQAGWVWLLYLVDAASFLPMIVLAAWLRRRHRVPPSSPSGGTKATLKEAVAYLATETTARRALMCYTVLSVGAAGGYVLQIVMATQVFGHLQTYTWFAIANSVGVVIGAIIVKRRKGPTLRWVRSATAAALLFWAALGISHWLVPTLFLVVAECGAYIVSEQLATPLLYGGSEPLRERVIGVVQSIGQAGAVVSNLLVGLLTPLIGVQAALVLMGTGGVVALGLSWGASNCKVQGK